MNGAWPARRDRQSRSGCRQRRRFHRRRGGGTTTNTGGVHRLEAARRPQPRAPIKSSPGCARSSNPGPGATLYLQASQDVRVGGRLSNAQYQYTLQGDNLTELNAWAPAHAARHCGRCRASPTSAAISRDRGLQALARLSTATRPRGYGITPRLIDDTLYDAFGQRQVSTIYHR